MANLLLIYDGQEILHNLRNKQDLQKEWNFYFSEVTDNSLLYLENITKDIELHSIVFSFNLTANTYQLISTIHQKKPLISLIYCFTSLRNHQFIRLYESGIKYCFIGEKIDSNLNKCLEPIWQKHWKRVPPGLLKNKNNLTFRGKKIIRFFEDYPLQHCTSKFFATNLNISESCFRKEFRRIFLLSFKDFKTNLIEHYESRLLMRDKYRPRDIYKDLDYKNLSAYSRAFKNRHGKTWQELAKENLNK